MVTLCGALGLLGAVFLGGEFQDVESRFMESAFHCASGVVADLRQVSDNVVETP